MMKCPNHNIPISNAPLWIVSDHDISNLLTKTQDRVDRATDRDRLLDNDKVDSCGPTQAKIPTGLLQET